MDTRIPMDTLYEVVLRILDTSDTTVSHILQYV